MTVKAKRAKALPLLDKDTGPATGELVDESISADAESLIQSLDGQFGDEFLPWFRSQIGTFRAIHELPATHEELRMVGELLRCLQEVRLRSNNLPPDAAACMEVHCRRRNQRPYQGPGGLLAEHEALTGELVSKLEATQETLESRPVMRGRKSTSSRDQLLADVAAYTIAHAQKRITKRRAAKVARDLLAAAGIDVPDDQYEVEKLIRRQKSGGK
ncbi:hypothetical protein [Pseudomonas sp. PDM07]|uniref:hypothetical protein n=1 Tax=Pseudomonas sp. PDM07 TaxID=2769264 RepID=UPI00177E12FC|nr:hypothetical protein [Pseudomonas sp. PDM07]MBD9619465.1 hypothetical protein [Pseudomonas sp. PDM07]